MGLSVTPRLVAKGNKSSKKILKQGSGKKNQTIDEIMNSTFDPSSMPNRLSQMSNVREMDEEAFKR